MAEVGSSKNKEPPHELHLKDIFDPGGAYSLFKNSYINSRCKYMQMPQEGHQKNQRNVWTFGDRTEALRSLNVSCLIDIYHISKGGEKLQHPRLHVHMSRTTHLTLCSS